MREAIVVEERIGSVSRRVRKARVSECLFTINAMIPDRPLRPGRSRIAMGIPQSAFPVVSGEPKGGVLVRREPFNQRSRFEIIGPDPAGVDQMHHLGRFGCYADM